MPQSQQTIVVPKVTLNAEQQCYVFSHEGYVASRGFYSLFREAEALADVLNCPELKPADNEFGSLEAISKHTALIERAGSMRSLGTWYNPDTLPEVRSVLESARRSAEKIRVYYGDTITGRDWMEANDVIGFIGRSTGVLKIPLLLVDDAYDGAAILDNCIVRIQRVCDGRDLYRHPLYHQEPIKMIEGLKGEHPYVVEIGGKTHAQFKTIGAMAEWIAFMTGESMRLRDS